MKKNLGDENANEFIQHSIFDKSDVMTYSGFNISQEGK